ncbi:MAG: ABC transporter permease [Bacteroidota bacterium]|nr:ABC transporter permease [Bacteroidota bacterium]
MKLGNDFLYENIVIAWNSMRSNLLRTILTVLIIAVGISALTGILTATQAVKKSISSEFTQMGAGSFVIQSREMNIQMGGERKRRKNNPQITYRQANKFKNKFDFPAKVSIHSRVTSIATAKYKEEESDPNIPVLGVDNHYLLAGGFTLENGRNFTESEIKSGLNRAILGSEIKHELFEEKDPLGEIIRISGKHYKVIGYTESKGSSMGFSDDRLVMIPLTNARQYYSMTNRSFKISVVPNLDVEIQAATGEAEGVFRQIRKLDIKDETDFAIIRSDNLANLLIDNIGYVTFAAGIIGFITLFGAAIGLMNMMLVSVSERTKEIGLRKTLGAGSGVIRKQFLIESVFIGQIGGVLGIIMGLFIGNIVSFAIGSNFVVPWFEIIFAVILCFVVGVLSGLLPAIKASKLDPIIALRYE